MRRLSVLTGWACFLTLAIGLAQPAATSQNSSSSPAASDADKPRVFITDSQSWDMSAYGGGGAGGGGSMARGGARPQTAEIVKTFGQRCPQVVTNNIQSKADYVVVLDHEGGKSFVRHKNKVAVFARVTGDSVVSKSTVSLGGSVQDACEAITKDWEAHGAALREGAAAAAKATAPQPVAATMMAPAPAPAAPANGKVTVASVPDGADIEVDGSFVGNAPSDVELTEGDHTITVKKTGFKDWQRKVKVSGGSSVRLNAQLEQAQ
jgi:hypothetical protein